MDILSHGLCYMLENIIWIYVKTSLGLSYVIGKIIVRELYFGTMELIYCLNYGFEMLMRVVSIF
jgi:hypothetical protein